MLQNKKDEEGGEGRSKNSRMSLRGAKAETLFKKRGFLRPLIYHLRGKG
jgi:hypothetical protein